MAAKMDEIARVLSGTLEVPPNPAANAFVYVLLNVNPHGKPCEMPCIDEYCAPCAMTECKHGEPLHRHHDGCPAWTPGEPCHLGTHDYWMDLQFKSLHGRRLENVRR